MHLIEPVIIGNYDQNFGSHLIDNAGNRRDTWESTEDAYQVLKSRPTWRKWDNRILRIYVVGPAQRPLDERTNECGTQTGTWSSIVTYRRIPRSEGWGDAQMHKETRGGRFAEPQDYVSFIALQATFRDHRSSTVAYRFLPYILKKIPTHITYGEKADFL